MLTFKYLLFSVALTLFLIAVGVVLYDVRQFLLGRRRAAEKNETFTPGPVRWRTSIALAMLAWIPMLTAFGIVVIPSGHAGVRISQLSGTRPGTLWPSPPAR